MKRLSEKLNVSEYEENTQSVKDDRSDEEIRIAIAFSGGKLKASEYEENAVMHVMLMDTKVLLMLLVLILMLLLLEDNLL